jgi:hypothetical protein
MEQWYVFETIASLGSQNKEVKVNFHIRTMHLDIIKVFYSPTNAQVIVLKNNIKIYIKIATLMQILILSF